MLFVCGKLSPVEALRIFALPVVIVSMITDCFATQSPHTNIGSVEEAE